MANILISNSENVELHELARLFDPEYVKLHKISCVTLLRKISGEGLKETKDFFEQLIVPRITESSSKVTFGQSEEMEPEPKDKELAPPMFLIGHTYKQRDKTVVLIVGASNQGTSYETVYSIDPEENPIHRYNRRDFGRVTGTDHENPCDQNLQVI